MNNIVIKIGRFKYNCRETFTSLMTSKDQNYIHLQLNSILQLMAQQMLLISTTLEITSNGKFRNLDDSEITDLTSKVALKVGGSNGTDVPFTATINNDKNKITIDPSSDLDNSTTYWYGVVDGCYRVFN